ncbi:triose-phosphate isomerase [Candidatus Microgenomates bacterium]|nr:triose-phosphate isomerase [Candidatus Microgenomates bacterium]
MIFVNFKSGFEGTGERAIALIEKLTEAQNETSVPIIPVPHDLDIYQVFTKWEGEIWIQHTDYEYGDTGRNSLRLLKYWSVGGRKITGTFLNHSEHKYHSWDKLKLVVDEARELGIKTMVFGGTQEEFSNACDLVPDFVAFEPAELIASPTTSVAKSEPDEIKKAGEIAKKAGIPLIVGAGVKDSKDVSLSLSLGAVGVAVSSAIIRADDPKSVVLDLAKGFI